MTVNTGSYLQHNCVWGPADILESDENGIIPEQARVITQVVILDADKKADTVRGKTAANSAC